MICQMSSWHHVHNTTWSPFHIFLISSKNIFIFNFQIIYYASLLAGDMDSADLRREDPAPIADDSILGGSPKSEFRVTRSQPVDPLEAQLKVNVLDSRLPFIPFEEFYNEPLSDSVEMDKDFTNYKSEHTVSRI